MKIVIETIPHDKQRYSTAGDWFYKTEPVYENLPSGDTGPTQRVLYIKVSKLSDPRREALISVHELVEVLLCQHDGVTQESVDAFDRDFEAARIEGNVDEPGDDPRAPYMKQHSIATAVERLMAAELGVNWKEYGAEVEALP